MKLLVPRAVAGISETPRANRARCLETLRIQQNSADVGHHQLQPLSICQQGPDSHSRLGALGVSPREWKIHKKSGEEELKDLRREY